MNSSRVVIVLHGLGSHRWLMRPICRRLSHNHHSVVNWGYRSLFQPIAAHALALRQTIDRDFADANRIDFVAHSMGSVIIRQMLCEQPLQNIGRMVFITPPSQGSPLARIACPVIGRLCRCLPDISTSKNSLVNQLPRPPCATAVIAARADLLAPPSKTHLRGQSDHQLIWATHNSVLISRRVARMTDHFLRMGTLLAQESSNQN